MDKGFEKVVFSGVVLAWGCDTCFKHNMVRSRQKCHNIIIHRFNMFSNPLGSLRSIALRSFIISSFFHAYGIGVFLMTRIFGSYGERSLHIKPFDKEMSGNSLTHKGWSQHILQYWHHIAIKSLILSSVISSDERIWTESRYFNKHCNFWTFELNVALA